MNEQSFEYEVRRRWERRSRRGRPLAGLFILAVGGLLLLKALDIVIFPTWLFTWPMLLIVIGLLSGIRHGFRGGFWVIVLLAGGLAMANQVDPSLQVGRYIGPLALMGVGLIILLKPRRRFRNRDNEAPMGPTLPAAAGEEAGPAGYSSHMEDRNDFIDVTAVFGGVKKILLTKNFKGGDIVSFMGGSEIDLSGADFKGRVTLDATNIFGGTKLIIPPTWDVQSEMTAFFGGIDDKRQVGAITPDPDKRLVIDGTCVFGGIEIRSF